MMKKISGNKKCIGLAERGGYFVFDFINKNYLEKNIVPYSVSRKGKFTIKQKRRIEK
ncbi:MAG: hypothetical protein R2942_08170 [Ignavibacteria bacterium]